MSNYIIKQKLGDETYFLRYLALNQDTNEIVLLIRVKMDPDKPGIPSQFLKEISILQHFKHSCIANLLDVQYSSNCFSIIYEYMDSDLFNYFTSKKFSKDLFLSYSYQLISGIKFLHSSGIVHGNLSPNNVLINRNGCLRISDFRYSQIIQLQCQPSYYPARKSLNCTPPEFYFLNQADTFASDMWSIGCIISFMLLRHHLFICDSNVDHVMKIFLIFGYEAFQRWISLFNSENDEILKYANSISGVKNSLAEQFGSNIDPQLFDLIQKLLEIDPFKRITASEALNHPVFNCVSPKIKEHSSN